MTTYRFYHLALLPPLLLPAAALVARTVSEALHGGAPPPAGGMAAVVALLLGFGAFAAAPYALYLLVALPWARRRSDAALRRAAWAAPVLVAAILVGGFTIAVVLREGLDDFAETLSALAFLYGGSACVVGYAYVAAMHGVLALARRVGWVDPERTEAPEAQAVPDAPDAPDAHGARSPA
jgi:hypothetical protein